MDEGVFMKLKTTGFASPALDYDEKISFLLLYIIHDIVHNTIIYLWGGVYVGLFK